MQISKKICDIVEYYIENSEQQTTEHWAITSETLYRYIREYSRLLNKNVKAIKLEKDSQKAKEVIDTIDDILSDDKTPEDKKKEKIVNDLLQKYTLNELTSISKGYSPTINDYKPIKVDYKGNKIKIGIVSDTHMGSKYFFEEWWDSMIEVFLNEKVDFIVHVGDLVEGLSSRAGHVYDLKKIGYTPQKDYAIEMLKKIPSNINIYAISGNHDRWFLKAANANIVKDISDTLHNFHYIGSDEGDIYLNKNVYIKLWHGEDGSSYSYSYRIQKIVESLGLHEMPNILITGHVHKSFFVPSERGVACLSAGALCSISSFMRSKKLANHSGFWTMDVTFDDEKVLSCKPEFFPLQLEKESTLQFVDY
jgi:predicted phosphodiesterase